jgi:hypothetical protein
MREKEEVQYLEACLKQHHHFTPFVVSIDGLLGKEAKTLLKKLSSILLAEKWEKSYSESLCVATVCQCSHEHCKNNSPCHTPLLMGATSTNKPDEQPSTPVGRHGWCSASSATKSPIIVKIKTCPQI